MKRPILGAGMIVGILALGQAGCHHTDKAQTTDYIPKKADDPTAWTDKDVSKGSTDSAENAALPKSSRLKGSWSSEGQDIEKSLGVTN
jgi:hypothetical protein